MNQVMLIGRLTSKPELVVLNDGRKVLNILLAVPRQFKNSDGEYETDFLDCVLWGSTANNACEYCDKGDLIGVRGRLATEYYESADNKTHKKTNIIVDRLTFLSSKQAAAN